MSAEALGAVAGLAGVRGINGEGASAAAWGLLWALANYAHPDDGLCWYGQKTLAFRSGLSDSGVAKALKLLEAHGMISRRKRFRRDGSRAVDFIKVEVERIRALGVSPPSLSNDGHGLEDLSDGFDSSKPPKRRDQPHSVRGGDQPHLVRGGPSLSEGHETKGETKGDIAPAPLLDRDRVMTLAGSARASEATNPNMAMTTELVGLLAGPHACDAEADVYPAIADAAAWHLAQDGPGSMTTWKLARKIALRNRDRRLAGNPQPKGPDHDRADQPGRVPRSYADARSARADAELQAAARAIDEFDARQARRRDSQR